MQRLPYNPFCAGQAYLPDGRLVVAGGHAFDQEGYAATVIGSLGFPAVGIFTIAAAAAVLSAGATLAAGHGDGKKVFTVTDNRDGTATWAELDREMNSGRWYPTLITLGNGHVLILGGSRPVLDWSWHDLNEDFEYVTVRNDLIRTQKLTTYVE